MNKYQKKRKATRLLAEAKHWQMWSREESQHRLLRRRQLGTAQELKRQAMLVLSQDDDTPPAA